MYKIIIAILIVLYVIFFKLKITKYSLKSCNSKHFYISKVCEVEFDSYYNVYNPSIIKKNDTFICCVRLSTKTFRNMWMSLNGCNNYMSKLIFIEIKNKQVNKIIYSKHNNLMLEDPRMIDLGDKYLVSATEYDNKDYIFPVMCLYDKNYNFIKNIHYDKKSYFNKKSYTPQKNWAPFIHGDKILLHTDAYPSWTVYNINIETGFMEQIVKYPTKSFKKHFPNKHIRCSTSWVSYDDKYYICGLHTKTKDMLCVIRSAFVLIDKKTLLPKFISKEICFDENHDRIQFLSGLCMDNNNIVISYGLGDYKMIVSKISKHKLIFEQI